jgi:hypothetical protein
MRRLFGFAAFSMCFVITFAAISADEPQIGTRTMKQFDIQLAACGPRYSDCIADGEPYCKSEVSDVPIVRHAAAYADCLSDYQKVCRQNHCSEQTFTPNRYTSPSR